MINWGAPIYIYLWLAGMGGGAYFSAFLADRFSGGQHKALLRLSTYIAIPLVIIGTLLLIFDLGRPIRFWHLLARFIALSPMSLGVWILLIFAGGSVILVLLWWAEKLAALKQPIRSLSWLVSFLSWIVFIFSVLVMAYTGVLLSASNNPLWAGTIILPSLFVASAISTGLAVLVFVGRLGRFKEIPGRILARLSEADALVVIVELIVLIGFALWLGGGFMAGATEALKTLTMGILAAPFWIGVVLLALLIPLMLELWSWGRETKGAWQAMLTSSVCVLIGGLVLRAVIVVGGQL